MESSGFQKKIRSLSLSVSDVVNIFECPMQVYLRKKGVKAHFRYNYNYYIGTLVHEVLAEFVSFAKAPTLFEVSLDYSNQDTLYRCVEKQLYRMLISKMEKSSYSKSYFDVAWEYLKVMANYFTNLAFKNNVSFAEIFLFAEEPFSFNVTDSITIRGRFDLLVSDRNTLKLIDYKTKKEDFENDIIQVSLYAKGLEATTGKSVEPILLYIASNGLREMHFAKDEVDLTYKQVEKELLDFEKAMNGEKEARRAYNYSLCKQCTAARLPVCARNNDDG
jgi:CRISPR/Cas system-associated exonuclease Cas4 (RecB family)